MKLIVILTATPDIQSGKKIAQALIEKKLAACVSLKEGFVSLYRWKGRVKSSKETLLLIKSSGKNFKKVKNAIQTLHPYELPEIIALPVIEGSREYLSWVGRSLRE